jgi:hypothetical protein
MSIIIILIYSNIYSQSTDLTWNYPIKPGSPEFLNAPDFLGGLALLNIPDERIKQMNTYHLVKSCLNHPQFEWVWTLNSLQQGYDFIKENFNGFREPELRPDTALYLLKEYKKKGIHWDSI